MVGNYTNIHDLSDGDKLALNAFIASSKFDFIDANNCIVSDKFIANTTFGDSVLVGLNHYVSYCLGSGDFADEIKEQIRVLFFDCFDRYNKDYWYVIDCDSYEIAILKVDKLRSYFGF